MLTGCLCFFFVEVTTRHVYRFPSPHWKPEPSQKGHFALFQPSFLPLHYGLSLLYLESSAPPQPVLPLPEFSTGPPYTDLHHFSSPLCGDQSGTEPGDLGFFFLSFPPSMLLVS